MKSAYGRLLRAHGRQRMIRIGALSSGLFLLLPVLSSESVQAQAASDSDSAQPEAASAAADDTASPQQMSTVVVTAQRFLAGGDELPPAYSGGQIATGGRMGILGEQDSLSVPFNVLSYTSKNIEDHQYQNVGDIANTDPSVVVGTGYGNNAQTYNIRGFELAGDDISFGGLYGILPRQVINTQGIERVEIFKGASSFLNGVSPTGTGAGGTINLEPKRAGDAPMMRTTVGYDSKSHAYTSIDAGRRFGDNHQWGIRVNALRGSGGSAVDGDNDSRNSDFTLALDYRGTRLRSSIDVGYERDIYHGTRGGVYLGTDLPSLPKAPGARTNYTPDWNFSRLESTYGMWRGEYDLTDQWTGYAAFGLSKTHEYGVYGNPTLESSDGASSVGTRMNTVYDAKNAAYQAGVRGKVDTGFLHHSVNLGYSGELARNYGAYRMASISGGSTNINSPESVHPSDDYGDYNDGNMGAPSLRGRVRANGISLSDNISLLDDQVKVLFGGRYQQLSVRSWNYDTSPSSAFEKNGFTPVYGVTYQPTDYLSLYANYIEQLSPGSAVADTDSPQNGQYLGIERTKQYEAGMKLDFGRIGGSLSAFRIRQPNQSDGGNSSHIYNLDGIQQNKGIEAMVYGTPVKGWNMSGGVTWIDSDLKNQSTEANNGNDGIGVPKYKATLANSWQVPGGHGLVLTGDVIRTGSQYADDANKYRLKPWTRLDLGARYTTHLGKTPLTWRAAVNNVTNNGYWSAADSYGYINMGEPRTFRLSISADL